MQGGGYLAAGNMFLQGFAAAENNRNQEVAARMDSRRYEAAAVADRYNAAVLALRSEQLNSSTNQREESARRQARMLAGRNRAAAAENGMGAGGTTADALAQSELLAELDVLNIRYEGNLQAHGALQESKFAEWSAANNQANAAFMSSEADHIGRMRPFAVAAGMLSGGAQGASFLR